MGAGRTILLTVWPRPDGPGWPVRAYDAVIAQPRISRTNRTDERIPRFSDRTPKC
jgi:hypothetical protein